MSRPMAELILGDDEGQTLKTWASRPKSTQRLATRARIVLDRAEGIDNKAVAAMLGVCSATVGTWRARFVERGLGAWPTSPGRVPPHDLRRRCRADRHPDPGDQAQGGHPLEHPRPGRGRGALAVLGRADLAGLRPEAAPGRAGPFKLSTDPYFVEKVRDVVGLYVSPPERAIVLCVDEKSQVQAPGRTRPLPPMTPAKGERPAHDYVRNGATSLFAALNVATGVVIGQCHRRHRHRHRDFLDELDSKLARRGWRSTWCWTTTRRTRRR